MTTYIEIPSQEVEIDADEIIGDAHGAVYSIAEEAIAEYDFSEVVRDAIESEVDDAVRERMDDSIGAYLQENPAAILDAISKALKWASERQRLVLDQATEMQELRIKLTEARREIEKIHPELTDPDPRETPEEHMEEEQA